MTVYVVIHSASRASLIRCIIRGVYANIEEARTLAIAVSERDGLTRETSGSVELWSNGNSYVSIEAWAVR